ncbi:MAG: PPC domain-containing protein, partial [Planctomycetales bacterium]|nr:PPC domain-containing protein [Planctomycetales bacterium]
DGAEFEVTRKIYISPINGFARFLEIVTNTGTSTATYPLLIRTNVGSDSNTNIVGTSSGDTVASVDDHWLVTDDSDSAGDPVVTHLFGDGRGLAASTVDVSGDNIRYQFDLPLQPGETQVVMHFAAQATLRVTALENVEQLARLELDALQGLSVLELSQLVNFRNDVDDFFTLSIASGATVNISTETPNPHVPNVSNDLDPVVELLDSGGNIVATDDNSSADGRNAMLTYHATTGGDYVLRVASASGEGEYLARVSGYEMTSSPLDVIETIPSADPSLAQFPTYYTVAFSHGLLATSVQPDDLTVNGMPATGVDFVDGRTVRFMLDPAAYVGGGLYDVAISTGAVSSLTGSSSNLLQTTFFVDDIAPRVESVLWNGDGLPEDRILGPVPLHLTIQFSEPIRQENLDRNEFRVVSASGLAYIAQEFSYDPESRQLLATFPTLPEEEYTLILVSGDEAFEDFPGNDLDGESQGPNIDGTPTGDGVDGGDYVVTFAVDGATPQIDALFDPITPEGVGAEYVTVEGSTAFVGDVDDFATVIDAGETLHVALSGPDPNASWTLSVVDAQGDEIASASSSPGEDVRLNGVSIPTAGEYRVRVTGDVVDAAYSFEIVRNATRESTDTIPANPLVITPTNSYPGVERYVVRGTAVSTNPTTLIWAVQPESGDILTLDPSTGIIINRFAAPDQLDAAHRNIGLSMAELGDVLLYVNSDVDANVLYRLDPDSGAVLSTETIDSGTYDGLSYHRGNIFWGRVGEDLRRQAGYSGPLADGWGTDSPTRSVGGDDTGRLFVYT